MASSRKRSRRCRSCAASWTRRPARSPARKTATWTRTSATVPTQSSRPCSGCTPDEMGIGPIYAVPKLLKRNGLKMDDIDVWELNEAFASQVVYCRDKLGIPMEKLNPNGGSISIGHPFGMTGSRMVGTIANEMLRRKAKYGVVTMCIGGGQGAAGLFESCL